MAVFEHTPLMTYVDDGGGRHLLYPITRKECVDGLEEALQEARGVYAAGESPPKDTRLLWIDTGSGNILKFYDGSGWTAVKTAWA